MTQCKEGAQREGLMLDTPDELYKWFTHQVKDKKHSSLTLLFYTPIFGQIGDEKFARCLHYESVCRWAERQGCYLTSSV